MSIERVNPNIQSAHFDESRAFYTDFIDCDLAMDMGWIMTYASPSNPKAQITLLGDAGPETPHPQISMEVTDAAEVHARAVAQELEIVYPLTDGPWGVRRFFVVDPNGVVINVMSHLS